MGWEPVEGPVSAQAGEVTGASLRRLLMAPRWHLSPFLSLSLSLPLLLLFLHTVLRLYKTSRATDGSGFSQQLCASGVAR